MPRSSMRATARVAAVLLPFVCALMATAKPAAAGQVSLDRTLDNEQGAGRVKVTINVLTAEGGDPLPGIRVNFKNLGTGNSGFRMSHEDGSCDPYWVAYGTRLEIAPAEDDRFVFDEPPMLSVRVTFDSEYYFKGANLVPDLTGMTHDRARSRLESAGLQFTYSRMDPCPGTLTFGTIERCRARVDRVFAQRPAPGTRVRRGSTVDFTVGVWPPRREVTQVSFGFDREGTALSAQEACHRLLRDGFLTRISGVLQRGCRGGGVMRQNPAGGTPAAYGSEVELVLCADGPRESNVRLGRPLECSPRTTMP